MILGIDHCLVRVPDLDRGVAYYRDALGLVEVEREGGVSYLTCASSDHFDVALTTGPGGIDHSALEVDSQESLSALERALGKLGVATRSGRGSEPGIDASLSFDLPAGHEVELVVRAGPKAAYLANASTERPAGAVLERLDHVTFFVPDVRAAVNFVTQALAFRVSDVVKRREGDTAWVFAFTRAGSHHHDLAFSRSADGKSLLDHIAFRLKGISDLKVLADRLARQGFRAEYGIGRHGPGDNIFMYVKDPAGNRIELSTELAEVIDPTSPPTMWSLEDPLAALNVWAAVHAPPSFKEGT